MIEKVKQEEGKIDLVNTRLSDEEAMWVLQTVRDTKVTDINLSGSRITDLCVPMLVSWLKQPYAQSLDVSWTRISAASENAFLSVYNAYCKAKGAVVIVSSCTKGVNLEGMSNKAITILNGEKQRNDFEKQMAKEKEERETAKEEAKADRARRREEGEEVDEPEEEDEETQEVIYPMEKAKENQKKKIEESEKQMQEYLAKRDELDKLWNLDDASMTNLGAEDSELAVTPLTVIRGASLTDPFFLDGKEFRIPLEERTTLMSTLVEMAKVK